MLSLKGNDKNSKKNISHFLKARSKFQQKIVDLLDAMDLKKNYIFY